MKYSKNIYPKEIVLKAIKAYSEISQIEISEDDKYWVLAFCNCTVDEKRVIKEFSNYLIDAVNGADRIV